MSLRTVGIPPSIAEYEASTSSEADSVKTTNSTATVSQAANHANLKGLHVISSSGQNPYPGSSHRQAEQGRHLQTQDQLHAIQETEEKIARIKEKIDASDDEKSTAKLKRELKQYNSELKTLQGKINTAERETRHRTKNKAKSEQELSPNQRVDALHNTIADLSKEVDRAEKAGREKEAEALRETIQTLSEELQQLSASLPVSQQDHSSSSTVGHDLKPIDAIRQAISDHEKVIKKQDRKIRRSMAPDGDVSSLKKLKDEMKVIRAEHALLQKLLKDFSPEKTEEESSATEKHSDKVVSQPASDYPSALLRTTTRRRKERFGTANLESSDLQDVHQQSKSTKLIYPENKSRYFSREGLQKIEDHQGKIELCSTKLQALLKQIRKLEADLQKLRSDPGSGIAELRPKIKALKKLKNAHMNELINLSKLHAELEEIEAIILPGNFPHKSPAISLDHLKSGKTLRLEKIHKDKIKALEEKYKTERYGSVLRWALLSGAAGFATSFLLPNSVSRWAPPWYSGIVAPFVAGTLHVLLATPTVKSLMVTTWNSPAMSEFNNYWVLKGTSWGDYWRGETTLKKYADKNPKQKDKINIKQRLQQERPFREINRDRYTSEDLAYFSYTANYWVKAALAAAGTPYFSAQTTGSKLVEMTLHGMLGALSGALYVAGQQFFRRHDEKAKESVVPTAEISADQAAALRSWRDDLNAEIEKLYDQPNHPMMKALTKELRKTNRELLIATTKSKPGGTWEHEFMAQFGPTQLAYTISEALGRSLSLLPVAAVNYLTAEWRKSSDPLYMALGHAVSAVILIAPPGFSMRGIYSGVILAVITAFTGNKHKAVVTSMRNPLVDDDGDSLVSFGETRAHKHKVDADGDSLVSSASEISSSASKPEKTSETEKISAHIDESEDKSLVVGDVNAGGYESEESEEWVGNPLPGDADRM